MSVELHVLFSGKLPSKAALTRAMKELGFAVTIPGGGALANHSGYLPMKLRREESGVEFDVYDDRGTIAELAGEHFDPRFERCASFRWGGDEQGMVCALCAAAALAKLVDGVVLDEEEGRLSVDQAIAQAEETLKTVKPAEPRYGTRPADIKRYLKPLLELRSDLVVVGRQLLIRPVRHLLRGAFFDRTGDKYRFSITGYVQLLYNADSGTLGYDTSFARSPSQVWQPHFAPQLFDSLATDIFDRWGPVTTLEGLAAELGTNQGYLLPIMSLALAGERDRAAEFMERAERGETNEDHKSRIRALWEQLTMDIGGFCATLRAWEAEAVKALKLEHIWEPSPFPVELPAAEWGRAAEPVFTTKPWIPSPPGLWQELPTKPGEVRFAKDYRYGNGDLLLPAALSRDEAEERHRALEDYVMVACLPDGLLLMVEFSGWDRNNPEVLEYVSTWSPRVTLQIELRGATHVAAARASPDWDHTGIVELW
jgi:hypothetical protein